MKKPSIIIIGFVVAAAAIAALAYVFTMPKNKDNPITDTPTESTQTPVRGDLTIVFTDNGFEKTAYSVKAGSTIVVKNASTSKEVQFSSGAHPTHLEDPEINMGVLKPGESGSFVANTKGSHSFHDHLHDEHMGTLEVE